MDQYTTRRRTNGTAAAAGKGDPTLGRHHSGRTRQHPRGYPHPTRWSRFLGMLLMLLLLLGAMAVAGAIEAKADTRYQQEVALWDGMTTFDRSYYCSMPRRDAVLVWAAAMDEGEPLIEKRTIRIARRVLDRGCS